MPTPIRPTYDVVIVGARCAGAATAMLLARAGLRVLALDREREGSDTLSTHALMRGAVVQLSRWGLLDEIDGAGTPPIRRAVFHYGDERVDVEVKAREGMKGLYAPRRTVLDPVLVRAARDAGADLRFETAVHDVLRDRGGRVRGVRIADRDGSTREVEAELVIGADGLGSRVAALVGAETTRRARHASALVYAHVAGLPQDGYQWYWRPSASAGVIPTNEGRSCVFAGVPRHRAHELVRDPERGHQRVLHELSPELAEAVARAPQQGAMRAFAGRPGFLRRCWGPGWALVGDAAHFKDPLTAHGITDALRDAELLARAVLLGTERALREHEALRDSLSIEILDVSDAIASFEWDLERLRAHHAALTEAMGREVAALRRLDAARAA